MNTTYDDIHVRSLLGESHIKSTRSCTIKKSQRHFYNNVTATPVQNTWHNNHVIHLFFFLEKQLRLLDLSMHYLID